MVPPLADSIALAISRPYKSAPANAKSTNRSVRENRRETLTLVPWADLREGWPLALNEIDMASFLGLLVGCHLYKFGGECLLEATL